MVMAVECDRRIVRCPVCLENNAAVVEATNLNDFSSLTSRYRGKCMRCNFVWREVWKYGNEVVKVRICDIGKT
jgi:transcriptional regulator NrdR family protein